MHYLSPTYVTNWLFRFSRRLLYTGLLTAYAGRPEAWGREAPTDALMLKGPSRATNRCRRTIMTSQTSSQRDAVTSTPITRHEYTGMKRMHLKNPTMRG